MPLRFFGVSSLNRSTLLWTFSLCPIALLLLCTSSANAEDGYRLWLRYDRLPAPAVWMYSARINSFMVDGDSRSADVISDELHRALPGLLGKSISRAEKIDRDGVVVVLTVRSKLAANLNWNPQLESLGPEGFRIANVRLGGHSVVAIASAGDSGALYGTFRFLRLLQNLKPIEKLNIVEKPRLQLRMLDHWDNLDGSIERGYAGHSLWNWNELPEKIDSRLLDYARANASIGINAAALNNVNANAEILTAEYLRKVAAIAGVFRPYGIRVFLSARFSAPIDLGGLPTADPIDPSVARWWKNKADEIYKIIPDFGGFVVKANSEGQPGPRTYNRTHADGANMLAAALAPHHGILIWRAFVYDYQPGYDRAAAAYAELHPFDGKFAANVLLQVKNGPVDFQPREPFHPLFGSMPKTQVIPELQITQEYLGFSNHLVFLATMWREFLVSDTFARGLHSTVRRVTDGSLFNQRLTGMVGVANTGSDRNWTGHHFAQANWYAFGRLSWNPDLPAGEIADEWIAMTLTHDQKASALIARLMIESHQAAVDYMTPLGLHHLFWGGHHYGPAPWWNTEKRDDWNPVYYHRADNEGIGFDRTASGSNSVSQYQLPVRARFANLNTCPEKFLLWFHHVRWDHRMRSGRTLWDELALHYQRGVEWVRDARRQWDTLKPVIDDERHEAVAQKLAIQERDAIVWRDACLLYFQTFAKRPLPAGVERPAKTLNEYKAKGIDPLLH